MGRRGNSKKSSTLQSDPTNLNKSNKSETPKPNFFKKLGKWLLVLLSVGGSIGGIYKGIDTYRERNVSQKEKFDQEKKVEGDLKIRIPSFGPTSNAYINPEVLLQFKFDTPTYRFPKIRGIDISGIDSEPTVIVSMGRYLLNCFTEDLTKGINIFSEKNQPSFPCDTLAFKIAAARNRLYISVEFKDLKKEETVGVIQYNHWTLYKENMLNYFDTDSSLTVLDKQGKVVINVRYFSKVHILAIDGYFIGDDGVLVLNVEDPDSPFFEACISKTEVDWKTKAQKKISKIKLNPDDQFINLRKKLQTE